MGAINHRSVQALAMLLLVTFAASALPGTAMTVWSQFDRPLRGLTIVVDPGHGGIDDGTRAGGRYLEKDINLELGFALRDALQRLGATVFMTRESDISLSKRDKVYPGRHREDLARRVAIVHEHQADLFISVHCNACPEYPAARGAIVYYADVSSVSKQMAERVQGRLNGMNLDDFGARVRPHAAVGADYFVLRNTLGPGILLEAGYLSNGVDLRLLTNKEYQASLAHSVSMGVADWRRLPAPEPEPEQTAARAMAILFRPNLAQASWTDLLMQEVPLTFVLDPADGRSLAAADMISASGHDVAPLNVTPKAGLRENSDAAVVSLNLSDSVAVISLAGGNDESKHIPVLKWSSGLAHQLQDAIHGTDMLLIDLTGYGGLRMPDTLLQTLKQMLQNNQLQPVFATDIICPPEHHGP